MTTSNLPTFGLVYNRVDDQPVPVIGANLDVVGIVGPCSTADVDVFPANKPVLVFSNDTETLAALGTGGVFDGYIADAVNAINDQLADYEVAAQLVIVRTEYGGAENTDVKLQETIANIMGDSVTGTGVWALLKAPNTLYCTPRIVLCPGYTGQMANTLDHITVDTPGVAYKPGATYQLSFSPGAGETNGAQLIMPIVHAVARSDGSIHTSDLVYDTHGAWMTVAPEVSFPPNDGPAIEAVAATGQFIFSANPGIGATLNLDGTTVTFASAPAAGATASGAHLTGGDVGVKATGSIVFAYNPSEGDTITLGTSTVTFVGSGASGKEVNIGVNLAATLASLKSMLNASQDAQIVLCTAGYDVTGGNTLTIQYATTGTSGNGFAIGASVRSLQVLLATNLASTLDNLLAFLQATHDTNIYDNTYDLVAGTISITSKTAGVAGNSFVIGGTVTGMTTTGPRLSGGQDAAAGTRALGTAYIALGANPVCATLGGGVLSSLMGCAWVESTGTSLVADEDWRDTLDSPRLIPISGGVKVMDPVSGLPIIMPAAPRIAGLQIAKDFATGFPFHSAANRPVNGIVGPARAINFSLTDGACEGQQLLAANIGIIVRGLVGIESAISAGGFVYIGTDNASSDSLWQFYSTVRGRDYIELSLMPALRTYLGQSNIDAQTVMNILGTIKNFLGTLQAFGQILGYNVNFKGTLNSAEEIRQGHLTVGFQAEEPSPLRRITTESARYAPAIDALVLQLEQQLNIAA